MHLVRKIAPVAAIAALRLASGAYLGPSQAIGLLFMRAPCKSETRLFRHHLVCFQIEVTLRIVDNHPSTMRSLRRPHDTMFRGRDAYWISRRIS